MMHPTHHIASAQLRRNAAGRPMHRGAMMMIIGLLFITPAALGQLVQISIHIDPKTIMQPEGIFAFHYVPDFTTGTGYYAGTYSVKIAAPENQMIHLRYNTGARLYTPEGNSQPIFTTVCYDNTSVHNQPDSTPSAITCPPITPAEKQTTSFPISDQHLLITAMPLQPAMLYAMVSINLQTPLPQYPADQYTADILLCIEYN